MLKDSSYDRVYTGSQIEVNHVKNLLEEKNIHAVIRNDFESGLRGGFGGGIPNHVQLFVKKEDMVTAKRVVDTAFAKGIPEEVLAQQAEQSRLAEEEAVHKTGERPLIKKNADAPRRSVLNLVLNIGLILYSAWRLLPLLRGEELPAWRIAISGFILVFCAVALINHFRRKA